MTENQTRMIKEKIKLSACQEHDHVYMSHKTKSSNWLYLGHVILVKIKDIGKNRIQFKYRKEIYGGNVLKSIVPADIIVERTRPWVEADGEDAGYWVRKPTVFRVPSLPPEPEPQVIKPIESLMHILMGRGRYGSTLGMPLSVTALMEDYIDMTGVNPPQVSMFPTNWSEDFLKGLEQLKNEGGKTIVIDSLTDTADFYPKE